LFLSGTRVGLLRYDVGRIGGADYGEAGVYFVTIALINGEVFLEESKMAGWS
jgi:hypothetical protein